MSTFVRVCLRARVCVRLFARVRMSMCAVCLRVIAFVSLSVCV